MERQVKLLFSKSKYGLKNLRSFIKRFKLNLQFSKPFTQETMRWDAVTADILAVDFALLLELFSEHYFDAPQIWNLDETGGSARNDLFSGSNAKQIARKDG